MIRPLLTPRRVTGNAQAGLISAARGGVRNVQSSTNTISRAPDVTREQRFGMNYVEFFGSQKTYKILQKSMRTIRDSMVSTFAIAKDLKESVKSGSGVFGFIGKIITFGAIALPFLPFFGIIKTILGLVALGGVGALLFKFKDQIIRFFERTPEIASKIFEIIKSKVAGFTSYIKDIIADFLISRRMSKEFQTIRRASESRLEERVEAAGGTQDARIEEVDNEIRLLREEKEKFIEDNKSILRDKNAPDEEKEFYRSQLKAFDDRIYELQTGRVPTQQSITLPIFGRIKNPFDFLGGFAEDVTAEEGIYSTKDLEGLSGEERLDQVKRILSEFQNREDLSKAKLIYQRELETEGLLNLNQVDQALDVLQYLDAVEDPFADNKEIDKEFVKQLDTIYPIMPKRKKDSKIFGVNVDQGGAAGAINRSIGGGNNVSVLPMGNNSPKSDLISNSTTGLTDGPSMRLFPNVDVDNYVALINKSSLNVV